jgi:excinuclease ABC subunit C
MLDDATLNNLPETSGVYIFRDGEEKIIYVGKARSLRDRVRSYARDGGKDPKTERLVSQIRNVDVIITTNEKEAFLLENNLIKEHRPKYNVSLRDDKTYVSLKLTVNDRFPGLFITRKIENDGSRYFGPYPNVGDMREVLRIVQAFYPVRRCKNTLFKKRKRPCILKQIGKCLGPCAPGADEAAYAAMVQELSGFLSGKSEELMRDLETRIGKASALWRFEEAGQLKARYEAIKGMVERQYVHEHLGKNRDVWAFEEGGRDLRGVLLSFRKGVLIAKKVLKDATAVASTSEAVASFLFQFYATRPVPDEIILSHDLDEKVLLERHLRETRGTPVRIEGPGGRLARELIPLAFENLHSEVMPLSGAFAKALHLRGEPRRIEVYDISHIHGKNPTGVMVVFDDFKAAKQGYRVFHVRGEATMDDVAMMSEVLKRRMGDERIRPFPDLVVIDGGKGHIAAVERVLKAMDLDLQVIGIAKGERRKVLEDIVYLPRRKNPLPLGRASQVLKELARMRDEAHRFAITSHKRWKRKEDLG